MCVCPFIIPARSSSGGFTRVKERVGPVAASAQDAEAHVWVAQIEGYFKMWGPPRDACWFINPINYSYFRIINHSAIVIGVLNQVSYLRGPTL